MCLNENFSKVRIGENMCDAFHIQNLDTEMFHHYYFSTLL
jgi:hypothetical protein